MSQFAEDPVFTDKTPRTVKQLEELQKSYRKAFGRELPKSVELAMNVEKAPEKAS